MVNKEQINDYIDRSIEYAIMWYVNEIDEILKEENLTIMVKNFVFYSLPFILSYTIGKETIRETGIWSLVFVLWFMVCLGPWMLVILRLPYCMVFKLNELNIGTYQSRIEDYANK